MSSLGLANHATLGAPANGRAKLEVGNKHTGLAARFLGLSFTLRFAREGLPVQAVIAGEAKRILNAVFLAPLRISSSQRNLLSACSTMLNSHSLADVCTSRATSSSAPILRWSSARSPTVDVPTRLAVPLCAAGERVSLGLCRQNRPNLPAFRVFARRHRIELVDCERLAYTHNEPVFPIRLDIDATDDGLFGLRGYDHPRSSNAVRCQLARYDATISRAECLEASATWIR